MGTGPGLDTDSHRWRLAGQALHGDVGVEVALGFQKLARLARRRGDEARELDVGDRRPHGARGQPGHIEVRFQQTFQLARRLHFDAHSGLRLGR